MRRASTSVQRVNPEKARTVKVPNDLRSAVAQIPSEEGIDRLAALFHILGDPTRLKILNLIHRSQRGYATISDIKAQTIVNQSSVTHHTLILEAAGLITRTQLGKYTVCRSSL